MRVYNRYGRRDNMYKARIKILVKAEGQRYIDEVEAEFKQHPRARRRRRTPSPQAELDRVAASFVPPTLARSRAGAEAKVHEIVRAGAEADPEYDRWLERNVHAHQNPELARRDAVAQAPGPGARRRHRRPDGRRRRAGRPLQRRRAARHARPEPAAALGAPGRPARAVAGGAQGRLRQAPTSAC